MGLTITAVTLAGCGFVVGTYLSRVVGVLAGRRLDQETSESPWTLALVLALLCGLAALQTLGAGRELTVDARVPGVAAAVLLAVRGTPLIVTFAVGVAVTAAVRGVGLLA